VIPKQGTVDEVAGTKGMTSTVASPVSLDARTTEIILTFDNLGEAADEELGLPVDALPHFSVAEALPRVLSLLDGAGLQATFFVEAINVSRYPDAIAAIVDQGHELGCHAWRHESWHRLATEARRDVLRRSLAALRSCGAEVRGFRPPGGLLEGADFAALRKEGIRWASPAGRQAGVRDDVVCLPFAWRDIDAYFFAPVLAPLRQADGRSGEPLSSAQFAKAVEGRIDASLRSGGDEPLCLVFHPFLYTTEERFEVLAGLLDRLRSLRVSGGAYVGTGRAAAERIRERRDLGPPVFDRSTWA
jgi:peptidoglycan/xylan/chitin deacetylase (PgdA/CDA1 family)